MLRPSPSPVMTQTLSSGRATFIRRLLTNPATAAPAELYDTKVFSPKFAAGKLVYVADAALIETIFVDRPDDFPKGSIDQRILRPIFNDGLLLAEGGDWIDVRGVRKHVQGYMKEFLFDPKIVDMRVSVLSGGERSRLLLAREFAKASNLLVLDEPTNDLDLETLDLLQEVIADYEGTVLIVSHDRDFLDRTVTVTLGLDGTGKVDVVAGGYEDWQAKRQAPIGGKAKGEKSGDTHAPPPPPPPKPTKLSYKDQRDYELLPARIEELEAAIARGEQILADPDLYTSDPQRFANVSKGIENAREEKDAAEERWLELAEQVEAL